MKNLETHFRTLTSLSHREAVCEVPGDNTSGGWLLHCHLLELSARGTMRFFQVFNPSISAIGP